MNPSDLKVPLPDPYVFKSPLKRRLVSCLDRTGGLLFPIRRPAVNWGKVQRLAVLRLDHLGDVLLALPALEALRRAVPGAGIDFIVGPWAREIAETARVVDRVLVFEAPWFARPPRGRTREGIRSLAGLLGSGRYDAVVDFRGDFRHHLAAWMASVPLRLGQVITGGGFLLTHPARYMPGLHEAERNVDLLRQAGITAGKDPPWAGLRPSPEDESEAGRIRLSLKLEKPVIAIHPLPATPAKRWFPDRWSRLAEGLPEDYDVVAVGAPGDRPYLEEIQKQCRRKIGLADGSSRLPVLAAFLKTCRLYIGVDSGPAHIAAAVGIPVVSLFSGTNSAEQWGPWGPRVLVLQKRTECSPCERKECPFDNECMRRIEVGEVLEAAGRLL